MFCSRCGRPIPDPQSRFCPACGAPVAPPPGQDGATGQTDIPVGQDTVAGLTADAARLFDDTASARVATAAPERPAAPGDTFAPAPPHGGAPAGTRFCPNCGQPLAPGTRFCGQCGAVVRPPAPGAAARPAPAPAPQPAEAYDEPYDEAGAYEDTGLYDDDDEEPPRHSALTWALVGMAAVLLVALVAVVVVLFLRKNGAGAPGSVPASASVSTVQPAPSGAASAPASQPAGSEAAASPSPTPAATPAGAILPTDIVLHNAPPDATVACQGVAASFRSEEGAIGLDPAPLPNGCAITVASHDAAGNAVAQVVWYNASIREYSLTDVGWMPVGSDGSFEPGMDYLSTLASLYYESFLTAINEQDANLLRCCTQTNITEQSERVYSKDNAQSVWDTDTFDSQVDEASVKHDGARILFNVSFSADRTTRDKNETARISNHRTVELVWQDGAWRVNGIAFLSDDDFAAHNYADLHA